MQHNIKKIIFLWNIVIKLLFLEFNNMNNFVLIIVFQNNLNGIFIKDSQHK